MEPGERFLSPSIPRDPLGVALYFGVGQVAFGVLDSPVQVVNDVGVAVDRDVCLGCWVAADRQRPAEQMAPPPSVGRVLLPLA